MNCGPREKSEVGAGKTGPGESMAGQEVAYRWIEANDWGPGAILHPGATRWDSKGVGFSASMAASCTAILGLIFQ